MNPWLESVYRKSSNNVAVGTPDKDASINSNTLVLDSNNDKNVSELKSNFKNILVNYNVNNLNNNQILLFTTCCYDNISNDFDPDAFGIDILSDIISKISYSIDYLINIKFNEKSVNNMKWYENIDWFTFISYISQESNPLSTLLEILVILSDYIQLKPFFIASNLPALFIRILVLLEKRYNPDDNTFKKMDTYTEIPYLNYTLEMYKWATFYENECLELLLSLVENGLLFNDIIESESILSLFLFVKNFLFPNNYIKRISVIINKLIDNSKVFLTLIAYFEKNDIIDLLISSIKIPTKFLSKSSNSPYIFLTKSNKDSTNFNLSSCFQSILKKTFDQLAEENVTNIESLINNCVDTSFESIANYSFQIRTIICIVSKFLRESVKFIKSTPIKLKVNHEVLLESIIWLCANSAPVEEILALITPISNLAFIGNADLVAPRVDKLSTIFPIAIELPTSPVTILKRLSTTESNKGLVYPKIFIEFAKTKNVIRLSDSTFNPSLAVVEDIISKINSQSSFHNMKKIRNVEMIKILVEVFCNHDSIVVKNSILAHLYAIFSSSSLNYMLSFEQKVLMKISQNIEALDDFTKINYFELLTYVVHNLKLELTSLSALSASANVQAIRYVLLFNFWLLQQNSYFQNVLRETGMLDLIISTSLKFDMQLVDENRLVDKLCFTPHRRSATIHAFDLESLDKSAIERDKIHLNIEDDDSSCYNNSLISPLHNTQHNTSKIPPTPDLSLNTPRSKSVLKSIKNDLLTPPSSLSAPRLSRSGSKVAFSASNARRTSIIARGAKSPLIDYSLLELALQSLFSALYSNSENERIFLVANGQNALLGFIQYNALRTKSLDLLGEIILYENESENPLFDASTLNIVGHDNINSPVASNSIRSGTSLNDNGIKSFNNNQASFIDVLLSYLVSARCHIYAKCQILRSIRQMCSNHKIQSAFAENQGFSRIFSLLDTLNVSSLMKDPFMYFSLIQFQHLEIEISKIESSGGNNDNVLNENEKADLLLYLAQKHALLLVQEIFSCITAALKKNKVHRELWAQESSIFIQLFKKFHNSEILKIQNAPACISLWLIWLATEIVPSSLAPTSSLSSDSSNIFYSNSVVVSKFASTLQAEKYLQLSLNSLFSFEGLKLYDPLSFALPNTAVLYNPAAITVSIQLLPFCLPAFQHRILEFIRFQSFDNPRNKALCAAVDIISSIVDTYRDIILNTPSPQINRTSSVGRSSKEIISVSEMTDLLPLILEMIKSFASFSCSGNDIRSLISLLNDKQWEVGLDILTDAVQEGLGKWPYVQFSMKRYGYACGEIWSANGEQPWPPTSNAGYTFACWLCIDSFGKVDGSVIRILHLGSVDMYSLTDSYIINGELCLQTSSKNKIALNNFKFEEGVWYHICWTHTRHIFSTSVVRFYVNGKIVQTEKLAYITSSNARVKAFIGTPSKYQNPIDLRWKLGSCIFLEDVLSDDSISKLYVCGPKLAGLVRSGDSKHNYQITDVNEHYYNLTFSSQNEVDDEYTSESNVASFIPFDKILFFFSALNSMQASQALPNFFLKRGLSLSSKSTESHDQDSSLSNVEYAQFYNKQYGDSANDDKETYDARSMLLINSGRSTVSNAKLIGDCRVYFPVSVADSIRQVGGLKVLLPLFERDFSTSVARKILILFTFLLKDNPKNLRDLDLISGYDILALLLRKNSAYSMDIMIHELLSGFIGLSQSFASGIIRNEHAFQSFFLDFRVWEKSPIYIQQFLFQSFVTSVKDNPNSSTNLKKLLINIDTLSTVLAMISSESLSLEVLPFAIAYIRSLLFTNCEVTFWRELSYFIIAGISVANDTQKQDEISIRLLSKDNFHAFAASSSYKIYSNNILPSTKVKFNSNSAYSVTVVNQILFMLIQLTLSVENNVFNSLNSIFNSSFLLNLLDKTSNNDQITVSLVLRFLLAQFKRDKSLYDYFKAHKGYEDFSFVLIPYTGCYDVYYLLFKLVFFDSLTDGQLLLTSNPQENDNNVPSSIALRCCNEIIEHPDIQSKFEENICRPFLEEDILVMFYSVKNLNSFQIESIELISKILLFSIKDFIGKSVELDLLDISNSKNSKNRFKTSTLSSALPSRSNAIKTLTWGGNKRKNIERDVENSRLPKYDGKIVSLVISSLRMLFLNFEPLKEYFISKNSSLVVLLISGTFEICSICPVSVKQLVKLDSVDAVDNKSIAENTSNQQSFSTSLLSFFTPTDSIKVSTPQSHLEFSVSKYAVEELSAQLSCSLLSIGHTIDHELFLSKIAIPCIKSPYDNEVVNSIIDFVKILFLHNLCTDNNCEDFILKSLNFLLHHHGHHLSYIIYLFLLSVYNLLSEENILKYECLLPNICVLLVIIFKKIEGGVMRHGILYYLHVTWLIGIKISNCSTGKYLIYAKNIFSVFNRTIIILYTKIHSNASVLSPDTSEACCDLHWLNRYLIIHHAALFGETNVGVPSLSPYLTKFLCHQLIDYVIPTPVDTPLKDAYLKFISLNDLKKSSRCLLSCITRLCLDELVLFLTLQEGNTNDDLFTQGFDKLLGQDLDFLEFQKWLAHDSTVDRLHQIMKLKWSKLEYLINETSLESLIPIVNKNLNVPSFAAALSHESIKGHLKILEFRALHIRNNAEEFVKSILSNYYHQQVENDFKNANRWMLVLDNLKYQRSILMQGATYQQKLLTDISNVKSQSNAPTLKEDSEMEGFKTLVGSDLYMEESLSFIQSNSRHYESQPIYQRWRIDFSEGIGRARSLLERPTFKFADVNAWISVTRRSNLQRPKMILQDNLVDDAHSSLKSSDSEGSDAEESSKFRRTKESDINMTDVDLVELIIGPNESLLVSENVERIEGTDEFKGLVLISCLNIYILDGLRKGPDGNFKFELSQSFMNTPGVWKRNLFEVFLIHPHRYLGCLTSLEMRFIDGRNCLISFENEAKLNEVSSLLVQILTSFCSDNSLSYRSDYNSINIYRPLLLFDPSIDDETKKDFSSSLFGAKNISLSSGFFNYKRDESKVTILKPERNNAFGSLSSEKQLLLSQVSSLWTNGKISNFDYIMHLNTLAGRTYSDLSQYPVFPWIISDYESEELDLLNPKVFRDLSKPMGALTEPRAESIRQRFQDWDDPNIPKFHYGTHYSSAAVVLYYLIRLEPFTQYLLQLQTGNFDKPDRLFHSIKDTWLFASQLASSDVKELIPEFFYQPEFLINGNKVDFGCRQDNEQIDDVILPPWAHGSARYFVQLNRMALESPYVSANLHLWIDLIFGYKQQGPAAANAQNVFYYVMYPNLLNLNNITDSLIKNSTIEQLRSFGQIPDQLFKVEHKAKLKCSEFPLLFFESAQISLFESFTSSHSIGQLSVLPGNRIISSPPNRFVLCNGSQYYSWGFPDGTLRHCQTNDDKIITIYKNMHDGMITNFTMTADGEYLITGGSDTIVCIWKITRDITSSEKMGAKSPASAEKVKKLKKSFLITDLHFGKYTFYASFTGHRTSISSLAVSKTGNLIASGSNDGIVIVWDLTQKVCIKRIHETHLIGQNVVSLNFDANSGYLIVARTNSIQIFDPNINLVLTHQLRSTLSDMISTLLVPNLPVDYRTDSLLTLVTGHFDGSVCFWELNYDYDYIDPEENDFIGVVDVSQLRIQSSVASSTLDSLNDFSKESNFFSSSTISSNQSDNKNLKLSSCYSWQLKSTAILSSNKFSSITSLCLSSNLQSLWVGDSSGNIFGWCVKENAEEDIITPGTGEKVVRSYSMWGDTFEPCSVCEKSNYRNTIDRMRCIYCSDWACNSCWLEHIRKFHNPV